jgi:hypothetical protein
VSPVAQEISGDTVYESFIVRLEQAKPHQQSIMRPEIAETHTANHYCSYGRGDILGEGSDCCLKPDFTDDKHYQYYAGGPIEPTNEADSDEYDTLNIDPEDIVEDTNNEP